MSKKKSLSVDAFIGGRIRELRVEAGISQGALAAAIGVTFQQVQKYENGTNRIAVSRLLMIARALRVRPNLLFDGAPDADGESVQTGGNRRPSRARAAA